MPSRRHRHGLIAASLLFFCVSARSLAADSPPVVQHDIQFRSHDVALRGTVFVPGDRKVDAGIVIVHGSGQEERRTGLGRFYAERGIVVLTYDKRGVGQSGGTYVGPEVGTNNIAPSNLQLLADDAAEALAQLRREPLLRGRPTGFLGASQAGWIIPLAVRKARHADFMVLFSGPTTSTREQLRFQFTTQGDKAYWSSHSEQAADAALVSPESLPPFEDFDPRDTLERLHLPSLWLYGGQDIQTRVRDSTRILDSLRSAGHSRFEYRLYPTVGHGTSNVDEPLLDALRWMEERASRRAD